MAGKDTQPNQTVADNRKAQHDYFIDERYEAGLTCASRFLLGLVTSLAQQPGMVARSAWFRAR